jgi:guanosine-3',5'-bis(diphosphate) 3'-pyrophosphohydrolase
MIVHKDSLKIILKAKQFARQAHETIFFPTTSGYKKPQFEHLQEVADLIWAAGGSDTEIAAAWLHDSVEDTSTTLEDLEKMFGNEIADIVSGLTDRNDITGMPTLDRKTIQAERIKTKNVSVRKIKIADQTSNIRTVTLDAPDGWSHEDNRNYVIGANLIADQCKGISQILDDAFDREYILAKEYFNI